MRHRSYIAPFPEEAGQRLYLDTCGARVLAGFSVSGGAEAALWASGEGTQFLLEEQSSPLCDITLPVIYTGVDAASAELCRDTWSFTDSPSPRARVIGGIRRLERALWGEIVLNVGDGCLYRCVLTGIGEESWRGNVRCSRTYTLQGRRILPEVSGELKPSGKLLCLSSVPKTDCALQVKLNVAADIPVRLRLNGRSWIYTPEESGEKWLILDGNRRILALRNVSEGETEKAAAKFLWNGFPVLKPGSNILHAEENRDGTWKTLTIQGGRWAYYPTFC